MQPHHDWTLLEYNEYFMIKLYQARYQDILDMYQSTFTSANIGMSSGSFNVILATFIMLGQEDKAQQLIHDAVHRFKVWPDIRDFRRTMNRCLPGDSQVVQTGTGLIARFGFAHVDVLNSNLAHLLRNRTVDDALWVYDEAMRHGHPMNFKTYSLLICSLMDAKKNRLCLTIYQQMRRQGLVADRSIGSAMLSLYAHRRQLDEAENLVREMLSAGHTMNEVIYNQLIKVYFKCRRMDKALQTFDALQKDPQLKVNDIVLNTMVDGLVMNRQLQAAQLLYQQILDKSDVLVRPDKVTFNTLLKGFVANKDYRSAQDVISDMVRYGCEPDTVTFTTLVNSFFDLENPTDTRQLLSTLQAVGLDKPNLYTFNAIIHGWIRAGNLAEAQAALAMLPTYNLQPSIHTYTSLLQGYADTMDLPKTMATFQHMVRSGIKPDRAAYHYLIHGLLHHDRYHEALASLQHMRRAQINPTIDTWRILLDSFVKTRQWDLGRDLIKELEQSGFSITFYIVSLQPSMAYEPHLLGLPNELILYVFGNFLELPDVWTLLQVSSPVRRFAMDTIQKRWKIEMIHTADSMMKIQCRGALIALEALSRQLCLHTTDWPLAPRSHDNKVFEDLMRQEDLLHQRIIRGITSYKHKYVLIEDIDIRNRIRATVDVIFHHAVFVSAMTRHTRDPLADDPQLQHHQTMTHQRSMAAMLVRLMTRLDAAFPSYCREITYTLADHIKAFLEYTGYKLLMQPHRHLPLTLHSMAACFDLMGASFVGKILGENHVECAIQRSCELLTESLVPVKKALLSDLLEDWLSIKRGLVAGELCRLVRTEIQKCDRPASSSSMDTLFNTFPLAPHQHMRLPQRPRIQPRHVPPPSTPVDEAMAALPSFLLEQRPPYSGSSSSSSSDTTLVQTQTSVYPS
ncbi:hypothetical protein DM01DRAFT_1286646 [Hesseltinella vesiculosa]|uniref:PROP1-like PPR domain-containing protein n=1 Tax=Hesseltinella vesiculosa TaxID=101127 RepID=A0A1X2GJJ7_9FUNG|nr:hypothetical protein DM01DRAFT_1286646 [Hesseltinella vesiculosa]